MCIRDSGHSDLILPRKNFDEYFVHDENETNLIDTHKQLINKMKAENQNGKNFFLYLHYSKIHTGLKNEVLIPYDNFKSSRIKVNFCNFFEISKNFIFEF